MKKSGSIGAAILLAVAACGPSEAQDSAAETGSEPVAASSEVASSPAAQHEGPPLGKYVCRQYMTTMGYLTLEDGGFYEVSGVRGRYAYDSATGEVVWEGGSYDEWDWTATYEHVVRPPEDGRPEEWILRVRDEAHGLKIDCFLMRDEREG